MRFNQLHLVAQLREILEERREAMAKETDSAKSASLGSQILCLDELIAFMERGDILSLPDTVRLDYAVNSLEFGAVATACFSVDPAEDFNVIVDQIRTITGIDLKPDHNPIRRRPCVDSVFGRILVVAGVPLFTLDELDRRAPHDRPRKPAVTDPDL